MPKKCLFLDMYRIFFKFKFFYCKICDFIPFNTPSQQIITLFFSFFTKGLGNDRQILYNVTANSIRYYVKGDLE